MRLVWLSRLPSESERSLIHEEELCKARHGRYSDSGWDYCSRGPCITSVFGAELPRGALNDLRERTKSPCRPYRYAGTDCKPAGASQSGTRRGGGSF